MSEEIETEEKKDLSEQKNQTKDTPTKSEEEARNKRIRRNCTCCALALLVIIIVAGIMIARFFSSSKNTTQPSTTNSSPTTYPTPENCQQVSTPSATAIELNTSNPGLKQDVKNHYYAVNGYNYTQLHEQVVACGPKVNDESFGGLANWNITWRFDWDPKAGSCGIKNETVGIKVDIYLPKWQQPEGYSDSSWENYITKLTEHENIHKSMAEEAAKKVMNSLTAMPDQPACEGAATQADAIGYKILDELNVQSANFDDETDHGANQM